jgi:hypothetical protein
MHGTGICGRHRTAAANTRPPTTNARSRRTVDVRRFSYSCDTGIRLDLPATAVILAAILVATFPCSVVDVGVLMNTPAEFAKFRQITFLIERELNLKKMKS